MLLNELHGHKDMPVEDELGRVFGLSGSPSLTSSGRILVITRLHSICVFFSLALRS